MLLIHKNCARSTVFFKTGFIRKIFEGNNLVINLSFPVFSEFFCTK